MPSDLQKKIFNRKIERTIKKRRQKASDETNDMRKETELMDNVDIANLQENMNKINKKKKRLLEEKDTVNNFEVTDVNKEPHKVKKKKRSRKDGDMVNYFKVTELMEEPHKVKKKKKLKNMDGEFQVSKIEPADNNHNIKKKKKKKEKLMVYMEGELEDTINDKTSNTDDEVTHELDVNTAMYICETERTFESLQSLVSNESLTAIDQMGFKDMTEIQYKCIPKLLQGFDMRGTAKTGSGKTLAFLIPAVELMRKLEFKQRNGTGVIIISPTRELSMQTFGVLKELMVKHTQSYGIIMGGANRKTEAKKLSEGINIIVATPGRLFDHLLHTDHFLIKNLCCLILDEADRILDVGFEQEIKQILNILPKNRQTMLFSATKGDRTNSLADLALKKDPIEVDVTSDTSQATVEGLEQAYLVCPLEKRFLVLYTFLKKNKNKKVMVFFSSCKAVKFYNELLNYIDLEVKNIHGKQSQLKRTSTFYQFCNAEKGILLCTDVAARGWDIPAVDWIVQYDPPDDPKEYIHRVGRTARAGGKGKALLFVTEDEVGFVYYLRQHKVNVDAMEISWNKVANIQPQLEKLMTQNYFLYKSSVEGFKAYVRAYNAHSLKTVFNVYKLDLKKVAQCFGLPVPPFVDLGDVNLKSASRANYSRNNSKYNNSKHKKSLIFRQVKRVTDD